MKRILFLFLCLLILFFPKTASSAGEFATDVDVQYQVLDSGITKVIHKISIENLFTNLYATSYNLTLENINPTNIKAIYKGKEIETITKVRGKNMDISINFDDAVVGKGKKRTFEIIYENSEFAQRTGEVWEITIPKLSSNSNFRSYNLSLSIPETFGLEAYVSPRPITTLRESGKFIYKFNKNIITQTGITAGFGAFQVFSFTLNYHLENPLSKTSQVEIAIPPDTNLQRVYYSAIVPKPSKVSIDPDGNWIALYNLKPRERTDIHVDGSVQIFSEPRTFLKPSDETLIKYLNSTEYWNSESEKIKEIALNYKNAKDIYNFVTNTLSYSYERVSPENKRLGALQSLSEVNNATCMEFTDLFIAIARAAGIPARQINGYAYTENPKIQPLSLVNDVLHSWPEYWNFKNQMWVQIDPTWASTTGGIDYFNKLDLRHFTFVIHGLDSVKPYTPGSYKLGPNPQKDVFVNFGSLPEKRNSSIKLNYTLIRNIPFMSSLYEIEVENEGPSALYSLKPTIIFDDKIYEEKYIEVLPPFGKTLFKVSIPYSILGKDTPTKAEVIVLDSILNLKTFKNRVITDSLFVLSILIILIVIFLIIRLKPKIILTFWYKILSLFKKDKNINKKGINNKNNFKLKKNKSIKD